MLELITPPSREDIFTLVDVQQVKDSKRISHTREDALIRDIILDSWAYIDGPQGKCRRAVLPQRWAFTRAGFGPYGWVFPVQGVSSIVSISYYDSSNVLQTADPANFWVSEEYGPQRVAFSSAWPAQTVYDRPDAVRVVFDAGWADPLHVPRVFRRALLLLAGYYYDNREAGFTDARVSGVSRMIQFGVEKLLEKYTVPLDFAGGRQVRSDGGLYVRLDGGGYAARW